MTMPRLCLVACCLGLLPLRSVAADAGLEQLRSFLRDTRTATAEFSQVVSGRAERKTSQASGTMAISRPGRFRWAYEAPYYQLIVGDGSKLWVYDKDLNQVTVKTLGDALGATPVALLAGDDALEKNFVLQELGRRDDLDWIEAVPKAQDGSFERVRIGFSGNLPRAMELRDNFGQVTSLSFKRLERNPKIDAGQFRFVPPKGADVVGE
jgi:outer membrane lipoprotein carrier protein